MTIRNQVRTHRALIIVDVQNDFTENGSLAVAGGDAVAAAVSAHVAAHANRYDLVVTTQDWHRDPGDHFSTTPDFVDSWPAHCVAGTTGADLDPLLDLTAAPDRTAVFKGQYAAAYSGFEGTTDHDGQGPRLAEVLTGRQVTQLDVVGIATDYCVKATALDAAAAGFATTVLVDLCAPVDQANVPDVAAQLTAAGVTVRGTR